MNYPRITSLSNPRIRKIMETRDKPPQKAQWIFVIEGLHLLETAISAGIGIHEVFFTNLFVSKCGYKLLRMLSRKSIDIFEITDQLMRKITDTESPQGIISLVSFNPPALQDLSVEANSFFTVLDGVQDPGNVGTLVRTSDAAGADAVILLPGTCNPLMPKVTRSTAGSIFHLQVVKAGAQDLIEWLHEKKILLAVTVAGKAQSVFSADLHGPVAFVFGNEARGISKKLRDKADLLLNVPIYGKAESLNVSAAAAVCLYEAARQKIMSRLP